MRCNILVFSLFGAVIARVLNTVAESSLTGSYPTGPRVDLGYATYEGTQLSNGINQFLGMRYAAPPIKNRRFRLPFDPIDEAGIVDAKQHGPLCYGVNSTSLPALQQHFSEDCLYIDLYVPANATRRNDAGLPIMLWIQGGAFVELFNPNYNGTGLIEAAQGNVIVAIFNYRVGPYGFLASKQLAEEGSLNIGLHDQRAAIRWIQKHAAAFGGDPNKVTLFGTSVGGGSVLMQLLAYGGNIPAHEASVKWSAGIAEAVYQPSVYSVEDMEFHYTDLLKATNCSDLNCLRSIPTNKFQMANLAVPFPGQQNIPLFGYGPVLDGNLIPDRPLNLLRQGRFLKDKPLIIGTSRSEGTIFVPQANSTEDINRFMKAQYPGLTNATLQKLNNLYSNTQATYPGATKAISSLFYRASQIFGDVSFTCSTLTFAEHLRGYGVPVHLFIDHILDPVEVANGFIVPHTWELQAVWGPKYSTQYTALPGANSYSIGKVNANIVPIVQGYWTSFVRSVGNPNLLKNEGSPIWQEFGNGHFLKLQTNATRMEDVDMQWAERRDFWSNIGVEIGQ